MADFNIAYEWLMDHEDRAREYKTVPDAPPGAFAISGINSNSFPNEFAIINGIPQAERGSWVKQFYCLKFWNKWLTQLISDEVAKRVCDASVNMGPTTPIKLLQECCGAAPDGKLGPDTIAHANACDQQTLVKAFIQARVDQYQKIVAAHPEMAGYLPAWTARASA